MAHLVVLMLCRGAAAMRNFVLSAEGGIAARRAPRSGVAQLARRCGLCLCAGAALISPAPAQTGTSNGAQMTVLTGHANMNGIASDANGNLYIADTARRRVLKETASASGYTESVVDDTLMGPEGVTVAPDGVVYVADWDASQIIKEVPSGSRYISSVLPFQYINNPSQVALDAQGNIYVTISTASLVLKEAPQADGSYLETIVSGYPDVNWPSGIVIDPSGAVYFTDWKAGTVLKATQSGDGSYVSQIIASGLDRPARIALGPDGNLYVADFGDNQVLKISVADGTYPQSQVPMQSLSSPVGIAFDAAGNLYVSNWLSGNVLELPTFWIKPLDGAGTQTAADGATAVFPLQAGPGAAQLYPGTASLSVAGLPDGATATFSPATFAADSGVQGIQLTVRMPASATASVHSFSKLSSGWGKTALALLLLPLFGTRRMRKSGRGLVLTALLLLGGIAGIGTLAGCGVTVGPGMSAQGAPYHLVVTMACQGTTQTSTAELVLKQQ